MFDNPDRELLRADITRCLQDSGSARISDMPLSSYRDKDILSELDAMFRAGKVSAVADGISRWATKWALKASITVEEIPVISTPYVSPLDDNPGEVVQRGSSAQRYCKKRLTDCHGLVDKGSQKCRFGHDQGEAYPPPLRDLVNPEKLIGAVARSYLDGPRGEPRVEDAHATLMWIADILAGTPAALESAAGLLVLGSTEEARKEKGWPAPLQWADLPQEDPNHGRTCPLCTGAVPAGTRYNHGYGFCVAQRRTGGG